MRKMRGIIVLLIIISFPTWFLGRRLLLPKYVYSGDKLIHKNDVYVRVNTDTTADRNYLGKQIGIAVRKDSAVVFITDMFFFGESIYEFKDDREHNRIFVDISMGAESCFDKVSK